MKDIIKIDLPGRRFLSDSCKQHLGKNRICRAKLIRQPLQILRPPAIGMKHDLKQIRLLALLISMGYIGLDKVYMMRLRLVHRVAHRDPSATFLAVNQLKIAVRMH